MKPSPSATHVAGPVPLKNVAAFMSMTMQLIERGPHLPGFGVCHGHSGLGKSLASIFAQNKTQAIRVEVGESWTKRTFLRTVLRELSMEPRKKSATIPDMAEDVIAALGDDPRRPLIVDEADKLVDKGHIELVRELQEHSGAPVILIGEEKLPAKLLQVERIHNRVLAWCPAQPCDLDDAKKLADAFAPKLTIADDLLKTILAQSQGRARRIVVNINRAVDIARNKGVHIVDLKHWGNSAFFTGEPPLPRHMQPFEKTRGAA